MIFEKSQYITSSTFLSAADVVYIANVTDQMINLIKNKNLKIISKNPFYKTIKSSNFSLSEGDIIYCNSSYLENLFYYLKNVKNLNNLALISGQSDRLIDEHIFSKKPDCIKTWFAINVTYSHKDLIPIPLGIANEYSPKNIRVSDIDNSKIKNFKKLEKLYVNLRKNTNLNERSGIENLFKDEEWVTFKEPNLNIKQYMTDLSLHKFVLCPWGNGIDTHRLWETLYSGGIPVTKFNTAYESFKNLPIIFVNNYEEINIDFLQKESMKVNKNKLDLLLNNYWIELIQKNQKVKNIKLQETVQEKFLFEKFYWKKLFIISKIRSRIKIIKFYLKKLNKFN